MTTFQQNQATHGFLTEIVQTVPEINGTAYTMRHAYSGAQLLYLDTEDEEKGFAIAFKTHPADNTGVFHILEHSVLRGSDKYPVKEPFVHLLKSSMKTYLNAATSSDCTMFPVASTNEKDLMNLMSVYLDAVFHPAILHEPRIFQQEGWHYEYDGERLAATGVVYNEMQGVLAQPNTALANALIEELFPDTAYRYVAGGVPEQIESLSYEQFVDTYKRHYKPSNAAIVLYGQLDINVFLLAIDECLRRAHDQAQSRRCDEPNATGLQAPVISTDRKIYMNALPEDAGIKFGSVFSETSDLLRTRAMNILCEALFGSNEAPLTRKLLDAGIATRVSGNASYSPVSRVSVSAHGVKPDSSEAFLQMLQDGCREILSTGISKELLEAATFSVEFEKRSNTGRGKPSASNQMMACLEMWATSGNLDARSISYDADFKLLKSAIQTDYYERLLEEAFLASDHYALVELCPTAADEASEAPTEKQPALEPLDRATIDRVLQETQDLKLYNDTPDSPEALKTLPRLERTDCLEAPYYAGYEVDDSACILALRHEYSESGLAHIVRYYDISSLSLEDFRYINVLIWLISETDTLRHTAAEVVRLKSGRLGLIDSRPLITTNYRDGSLGAYVWIYTCSLASDIEFNVTYVDEILHETVYANREKLRETVDGLYSLTKDIVVSGMPNLAASRRAESHVSPAGVLDDIEMGISAFTFLRDLKERLADDAEADKVLRRLQLIGARVFGTRPALISFGGDDVTFKRLMSAECALAPKYEEKTADILSNLTDEEAGYASHPFVGEVMPISGGDEAFIVPGSVAYCDLSDAPSRMSGCWNIANKAASLDYLWNEVRLKGSAYGVKFGAYAPGIAKLESFRDPNVDETFASFEEVGAWLRDFSPSDDELDGYVISATAAFDRPVRGFRKLFTQGCSHLRGKTPDDRVRERQEIVSCTAQDVRNLGKELAECAGKRSKVVIGSQELIEQSALDFTIVRLG